MGSINIIEQLASIDQSSFDGDEGYRMKALLAAKALVQRIEKPWERMTEIVWQQPILKLCFKTANDLKLFSYLSDRPQTTTQLAQLTGADAVLLARILRVLACGQMIAETDVDTWADNDFSAAMKDPDGLVRGIDHYYDVGTQQTANLPAYLKSIKYRNPDSADDLAFKFNMNLKDFDGDWWEFYRQNPTASDNFNGWLSSLRVDQPSWLGESAYPLPRLLEAYKPSTALVVDVAGGMGRDLSYVAESVQNDLPQARLVLQELPELISSLRETSPLPRQIELMPHNFFRAQPVVGARAYFMHSVLHDWPDKTAREILLRIKEVMTPGYSKILLYENKVPERARDTTLMMATLDINMMAHFASLERTEKQWRSLIEGAGLQYVAFYPFQGRNTGIIEVGLEK